jgi:glutathione peroxidase
MGILKSVITKFYGLRMKISRLTGMGINISANHTKQESLVSFYSLQAKTNNGEIVPFERFKGKKVLLVNLASQCGYTPQYNELEELYQLRKNEIIVLGFPSNDFGGQEPGTDEEIENFCKVNFGVTFPLFHKDHVTGDNKQPVYQWLSNPGENGWNDKEPSWNFYKYLVDENGNLHKVFSSSVSPLEIME